MFKIFKKNQMNNLEIKSQGYYPISKTCQIKDLSRIYELFLGKRENGEFIEFGGYDGEYASNTSGLADIGWKGIYIEPIEEYYLKCVERHKKNNVQIKKYAIGDKEDVIKISKAESISSISQDVIDKFETMPWSKGLHKNHFEQVVQKKLDTVLEECSATADFDILSIDVEGYEWKVLQGFTIERWIPKIIIIELHDNNENYDIEWTEASLIVNHLEDNNYRVIYKDFSNTIYLRKDIKQSTI